MITVLRTSDPLQLKAFLEITDMLHVAVFFLRKLVNQNHLKEDLTSIILN